MPATGSVTKSMTALMSSSRHQKPARPNCQGADGTQGQGPDLLWLDDQGVHETPPAVGFRTRKRNPIGRLRFPAPGITIAPAANMAAFIFKP